ncbi:hypothetical protein J4444_02450 [Candidatus Woesearchaeota archaeon]|nr:hypothetical protein [Candidatus Woesearchaeota archaeon]
MSHYYSSSSEQQIISQLLRKIVSLHKKGKTLIVGIQGGQGVGKTTLIEYLKEHLHAQGYRVQSFSIDDFYESYKKRQILAKKYALNPFYQIPRGMPGTHRVKAMKEILQKIKAGKPFVIPIFDKSSHHGRGDISSKHIRVLGRQDFILFDGWCLGMSTVSSPELIKICAKNGIKLGEIDPEFEYHKLVLSFNKLYQSLWKYIDFMVMMKADTPELHVRWRLKQEKELKKRTGKGLSDHEVKRLVSFYLPFTYLCYDKVKPDVLIGVNKKHVMYRKS